MGGGRGGGGGGGGGGRVGAVCQWSRTRGTMEDFLGVYVSKCRSWCMHVFRI